MANTGNKKVRKVKGLGSIYFDNVKNQWVGQIENGKYGNGRTKFKRFYGDGQNAVIDKMREYKNTHLDVPFDNNSNSELVGDYFKQFLTTIKKTQLKPSSYTRNFQLLNNHIVPNIGYIKLSTLTTTMIQTQLINKMLDNGYSYSSIHKAYVLVNEGLRYAYKQGALPSNPCDLVEEPSRKVAPSKKEIRFFNDSEIEAFKNAVNIKTNGKYHYRNGLAFLSIIYNGLRIGELLALKWNDINFENGFIRVHGNMVVAYNDENKRVILSQDTTKTKDQRIVQLTKTAGEIFQTIITEYNPSPEDYVYYSPHNRDTTIALNTYKLICAKANISNPQGVHTLRHTFASLLIRKGVDIKIISEMLGHSSATFTYNTYVHLLEEEKAKVIGKLDI